MPTSYRRLSFNEREEISRGLACKRSVRCIAKSLGRHPSTVSREVGRLHGRKRGYRAGTAQSCADASSASRRKGRTKLGANPRLRRHVERGLIAFWSPLQIAMSLKEEYPHDMDMRISPETIYGYVYVLPRGSLKKELIAGLRREHKYRRKRKKGPKIPETRGRIADMLSIEERPKEVADRIVHGHWEGDLIIGKHKRSALGTLVERTTRYAILVPLKAKDAASVRRAFAREMRRLPKEMARTLTYDQGSEMSQHKRFTIDTGIQVYFAHPSSPWERGTNENTNGLVRQFFPKGTDFSQVTAREIKRAQRLLNGRPRMTLDWKKPEHVFQKLVALES